MNVGKIEYAPNYGLNTAARLAVEGCNTETGLCGKTGIQDDTLYREFERTADEQGFDYGTGASPWPVPVATQLERLPTGIVYLGSPYSKQADREDAAIDAGIAAACLMERGHVVYAPIPHGHAISDYYDLPTEWDFWRHQCDPFIDVASSLVVLKLEGWRDSVGLTYEIARFHEAGKPIVYVTMEELA